MSCARFLRLCKVLALVQLGVDQNVCPQNDHGKLLSVWRDIYSFFFVGFPNAHHVFMGPSDQLPDSRGGKPVWWPFGTRPDSPPRERDDAQIAPA